MTNAGKKVSAARVAMVLDQPFFGALALQADIVEDPTCTTAWTDGVKIGYNPKFIASLTPAEVTAVIVHETMHCALGHPWRRGSRDHRRANAAMDYAINLLIVDAGFKLPEGCLLDRQYNGKSFEWIYDRLPDQPPTPQGGKEYSDPSGKFGEVRDAGSSQKGDTTEADWQQAVQQAARAAKMRGTLPSGMDQFCKNNAKTKVDWRSVLRRFVQDAARNDYSWRMPNQRYVAGGFYLPSLRSEEMGPIAVGVDTSGSIDRVLLEQFRSEVQAVVDEMRPSKTMVIYCDAKVHRIDTFERDDAVVFHPVGGGGTRFEPVFEALGDLEDVPVCLIYLTDMCGTFLSQEPEIPTLWVTPTLNMPGPFGETVEAI